MSLLVYSFNKYQHTFINIFILFSLTFTFKLKYHLKLIEYKTYKFLYLYKWQKLILDCKNKG